MTTAAALQMTAAILATIRAIVLWVLPRWAALGLAAQKASNDNVPAVSAHPFWLALVLWSDFVNDWTNRFVNEHLPAPGGSALSGLARAGAHLGLAMYAAWICGILGYVGLLVRHRLPRFGVTSAVILWLSFVVTNVLFYHEFRGDDALRGLGTLHILAFCCELRCLVLFAKAGVESFATERICAVWLVCLGLAPGIGPLRPWDLGALDRVTAEKSMEAAMAVLYGLIVVTILSRGVKCFMSCSGCFSWRSRG